MGQIQNGIQHSTRQYTLHPRLDLAAEKLENEITRSLQATTTEKEIRNNKPLPTDQRYEITHKRKLSKEYHRRLNPMIKTKLNKITSEIKTEINGHYKDEWDTEDNSLWKMTKSLTKGRQRDKIPPLKIGNNTVFRNLDKAEEFAKNLHQQFTSNESAKKYIPLHTYITHRTENWTKEDT